MRPELEGLPAPNWFHHGEQVLALLEASKPLECVELGTYLGGSAIAMARVLKGWGGHLTTIDAFDHGTTAELCAENLENAGVSVSILPLKTAQAAQEWGAPIDFLYVDADHSYDGCLADLRNWLPHVKVGGILCGDDYGRPEMNVTEAWDAFALEHPEVEFCRVPTPGVDGAFIYGVKQ